MACGSSYCAWVHVYPKYIDLYAEHDCGGEVEHERIEFKRGNYVNFMQKYNRAVKFVKKWTKK